MLLIVINELFGHVPVSAGCFQRVFQLRFVGNRAANVIAIRVLELTDDLQAAGHKDARDALALLDLVLVPQAL